MIDENDNVPQFSSDTYTAIINEEEPSGTPVTLVYTHTHTEREIVGNVLCGVLLLDFPYYCI